MVDNTAIGVSIGDSTFNDLDYADDVPIPVDLVDSLAAAPESFSDNAATLGLELNWRNRLSEPRRLSGTSRQHGSEWTDSNSC